MHISECKEYEALSYKEVLSPILITSAGTERIGICPWESGAIPAVSGGSKVELGEFPHMVSVLQVFIHIC